jgi:opacity protein-like surface antigen
MLKKALSAVALAFLCVSFAAAQEDVGHFDVSFSWGAVFNKTSSNAENSVAVSPTNSGLILGTFRFRFNRMNGIEVNGARTDNSQVLILGTTDYRAQTSVTEFSGAYVLSPFHFEKIEPFVLAGGGALRFYPSNQFINGNASFFGAAQQTSMAFLYGGGVDYRLWKRIGLRLQYRGLVYKEPTFHVTQFFTGAKGHMAEPSIGIVFNF